VGGVPYCEETNLLKLAEDPFAYCPTGQWGIALERSISRFEDLRDLFPSVRTLRDVWKGEEVYMIGKGPSAEKFDLSKLHPKLCINDSWKFVPDCEYNLTGDWQKASRLFDRPCRSKTLVDWQGLHLLARYGVKDMHWFARAGEEFALPEGVDSTAPEEERIKNGVFTWRPGSACLGVNFCILAGAKRVNLIGFDGGGGYVRCADFAFPPNPDKNYEVLKRSLYTFLHEMEVEFVDWSCH